MSDDKKSEFYHLGDCSGESVESPWLAYTAPTPPEETFLIPETTSNAASQNNPSFDRHARTVKRNSRSDVRQGPEAPSSSEWQVRTTDPIVGEQDKRDVYDSSTPPHLSHAGGAGEHMARHHRWGSFDLPHARDTEEVKHLPTPSPTPPIPYKPEHQRGSSDAGAQSSKRSVRSISNPVVFPPAIEHFRLLEIAQRLGIQTLNEHSDASIKRNIKEYFKWFSSIEAIRKFPDLIELFPDPQAAPSRRQRIEDTNQAGGRESSLTGEGSTDTNPGRSSFQDVQQREPDQSISDQIVQCSQSLGDASAGPHLRVLVAGARTLGVLPLGESNGAAPEHRWLPGVSHTSTSSPSFSAKPVANLVTGTFPHTGPGPTEGAKTPKDCCNQLSEEAPFNTAMSPMPTIGHEEDPPTDGHQSLTISGTRLQLPLRGIESRGVGEEQISKYYQMHMSSEEECMEPRQTAKIDDHRSLAADELTNKFRQLILDNVSGDDGGYDIHIIEELQSALRFIGDLTQGGLRKFQRCCPPSLPEFQGPASLVEEFVQGLSLPADDTAEKRYNNSPFKADLLRSFMDAETAMDYEYTSLLRAFVFRFDPSEAFTTYVEQCQFTTDNDLDPAYCTAAQGTVKMAVIRRELMMVRKVEVVEKILAKLGLGSCLLFHTTALGNAENVMTTGISSENLRTRGDFGTFGYYLNTSLAAALDWAEKRYSKNEYASVILIFEWPDELVYSFKRISGDEWRDLDRNSRKGRATEGHNGIQAFYGRQCCNPSELRKWGIPRPDKEKDQIAVRPDSTLQNRLVSDYLKSIIIFK